MIVLSFIFIFGKFSCWLVDWFIAASYIHFIHEFRVVGYRFSSQWIQTNQLTSLPINLLFDWMVWFYGCVWLGSTFTAFIGYRFPSQFKHNTPINLIQEEKIIDYGWMAGLLAGCKERRKQRKLKWKQMKFAGMEWARGRGASGS